MAFLIDGKKISSQIKDELKTEIAEMKKKGTEVTSCFLCLCRQQEESLCLYRYPLPGIRIA